MYLSLAEVAESFGVPERTVEEWTRAEHLPGILTRGRWIFDRAQVAGWAATRGLGARAGFLSLKRHAAGTRVEIETLLRRGGVWRSVAPEGVRDVLEGVVLAMPGVSGTVAPLLSRTVHTERGITWAPIGRGLALPHLRTGAALGRDSGTLALLLLSEALRDAEPTPDGVPVTRLWFFVAPSPRAHLDVLGRLSRSLREGALRDVALARFDDEGIFAAARATDEESDAETRAAP